MLETFSDGMGAWKYLPQPGHLFEQEETVIEDVIQWKLLTQIVEKMNREREKEKHGREQTI